MKYSLPLHALAFIAIVALSPYLNAKEESSIDAKKEALLSYLKSVAESDKYLRPALERFRLGKIKGKNR